MFLPLWCILFWQNFSNNEGNCCFRPLWENNFKSGTFYRSFSVPLHTFIIWFLCDKRINALVFIFILYCFFVLWGEVIFSCNDCNLIKIDLIRTSLVCLVFPSFFRQSTLNVFWESKRRILMELWVFVLLQQKPVLLCGDPNSAVTQIAWRRLIWCFTPAFSSKPDASLPPGVAGLMFVSQDELVGNSQSEAT